jgi:hypothetical protein
MLTGTRSWTVGQLPNGVTAQQDVSVSGAAVGDPVVAALTTIPFSGMLLDGRVSSPGTVTVSLSNFTGALQTLGAGTLNVIVLKF